jgi:DNA-binding transcriptional regulator LsrR (DeoR family)
MPAKKSPDHSLLIAAVAFEKSQGKYQQAIADALGISQPEVSRLLAEATSEGWLGRPSFTVVNVDTWQQAEDRFYSTAVLCADLRRRFGRQGQRLHRISLLHTGQDGRIDARAVGILTTLLGEAGTVGVTWGRTISRVVDALHARVADMPVRDKAGKVTFVPLCGEPLADGDPVSHSSSVLAMRLTEIFNAGNAATSAPSIAGVPAFIPLKVGKLKEETTIRHLISLVRGHARVFGIPDGPRGEVPPLVENLDAILTSVGRVDPDRRGIFLKERSQIGDISEAQMMRSVAGDMGGVIIPNPRIDADDERRITEMNDNWTGVRAEHLRKCADAAHGAGFNRKRPGVILLALGAHRLKVVLRCIELGLVNELVIDKELADELGKHLRAAGRPVGPAATSGTPAPVRTTQQPRHPTGRRTAFPVAGGGSG